MNQQNLPEPDKIDLVIRDTELKHRIQKLITESKESRLERLSAHPLTLLFVGFMLTWGIGDFLTGQIKSGQLENEKKLEQIKTKRETSLAAISKISELMYERYATASFLASSLKRHAPLEEIKSRKEIYDAAYLKWNIQVQNTQLIIRGLTADAAYSKIESYIQYGLTPHYNTIDSKLTAGYDSVMNGKRWNYKDTKLPKTLNKCLDCCYAISNYLWTRANLYGEEQNSSEQLTAAESELASRCPKNETSSD